MIILVTESPQDEPGHPPGGRDGGVEEGRGAPGEADRPQHVQEEEAGGGHLPTSPREVRSQHLLNISFYLNNPFF